MELLDIDISGIFGKKSWKNYSLQQSNREAFSGAVFKDLEEFHWVT